MRYYREKNLLLTIMILCTSSSNWIYSTSWNTQQYPAAYFLTAGQLLFDVWGFGWVCVGLGQLFGVLGWVDGNRPTDNSEWNMQVLFQQFTTRPCFQVFTL